MAKLKPGSHEAAAELLQETLDEEKAADAKLSSLAEGGINQGAADAAGSNETADEEEEEGAPAPKSGSKAAATKPTQRR